MVKIQDKNRVFQSPDEMVSHLLGFLVIIIDEQGGEIILEKLDDYAATDQFRDLIVEFDRENNSVKLSVKISNDKSNGNG